VYLKNGCVFAGAFFVRSYTSKSSFSVLRIASCLFSCFVSLSHLFISSMVDSVLLASVQSSEFVYPTGVCFLVVISDL